MRARWGSVRSDTAFVSDGSVFQLNVFDSLSFVYYHDMYLMAIMANTLISMYWTRVELSIVGSLTLMKCSFEPTIEKSSGVRRFRRSRAF